MSVIRVILKQKNDKFLIMTPTSVVEIPNHYDLLMNVADAISDMQVHGHESTEVTKDVSNQE
jgi:hypothetical protein